jgi:hypothetical protein
MKAKKFDKKLVLNKKTISDLNNLEMVEVKGGMDRPPSSRCFTVCGGPAC